MRERSNSMLYGLDSAICGGYQLPAETASLLDKRSSRRLARGRMTAAAGTAIQTLGNVLTTYGLGANTPSAVFATGIILSIFGGMGSVHIRNRIGIQGTTLMQNLLDQTIPHQTAIKATLVNAGFTNAEVKGIHHLPDDIHKSEIFFPRTRNVRAKSLPLVIGSALAFHGDYIPAAALVGAGMLSWPVGEALYRKFSRRTKEVRAGLSAKVGSYVGKKHKEFVRVTDMSNMVSFIPELIFACKYLFAKGAANYLSDLYGLIQSIQAFSDLVNSNITRESAKKTTAIAKKFIETITSSPYIFTRKRWQEHIAESAQEDATVPKQVPFPNGIVIERFVALQPSGKQTLKPLSFSVKSGTSTVIQAESGAGKSITLMGIMHLLEHSGLVFLVKNRKIKNIHELDGPGAIAKEIIFITEEGIDGDSKIADLFAEYFIDRHKELYNEQLQRHAGSDLVELAWKMADNLLENEITALENDEASMFPQSMLSDIKKMRKKRNEWVSFYLKNAEGNIANEKRVYPEKVFSDLSDGEKQRVLVTIVEAAVDVRQPTAVILDEPLANLDNIAGTTSDSRRVSNLTYQLNALKRIQAKTALIIVSHNTEELRQKLQCEIVLLEPIITITSIRREKVEPGFNEAVVIGYITPEGQESSSTIPACAYDPKGWERAQENLRRQIGEN